KLLNRPLSIAYVRSGKVEALNQFLGKLEITATSSEAQELYLQAGKEFLLKGNKATAAEYFNNIIKSEDTVADKKILADALFYNGEYAQAQNVLTEILQKNPEDIDSLAKLAICNKKLGNGSVAEKNIQSLEGLRADYQFG